VTASGTLGDGVEVDSPFLVGSLSKPFTATAVMRLVQGGRIDLDAPVTDYLPEFRTAEDKGTITIRHLLQQTSGLPTWAGQADLTSPSTTLEERVEAVAEVTPTAAPGEQFSYCNKNFAILGLVVQEVSGEPYGEYLQSEVLEPLGMTSSFTDLDQARSHGLIGGSTVWFGAHVPAHVSAFPGALPDGYVVSSVPDLARFAQVQITGTIDGEAFLSEESLQAMHEVPEGVAPDEFYDARYGLGWRVADREGQPVVFHEGELGAYRADLAILPEDGSALIVLSAHNTLFTTTDASRDGGVAILAGGSAPVVDTSFTTAYLGILALGAVVVAGVVGAGMRLVRRLRDLPRRLALKGPVRTALLPVLLHLAFGAGLYIGVFWALGQSLGLPGMLPLSVSLSSAPDVTVVVLLPVVYCLVAALAYAVMGGRARMRTARLGTSPA
jgi:CubicO group peptidase (beta-lactamase class C family)